jgi:3-oxoacyl-[acyl-carrier protein] reductase
MLDLQGRVVLVTGGAGGIGAATVRTLAQAGAAGVCINYRGSKPSAEALADDVRALGAEPMCIQADVRDDVQVRAMIDRIEKGFGRLDVLVNNAGTTHWVPLGDLDALTEEVWDETLDVNLRGAFRTTRASATLLEAASGVVINVASISGMLAPPTLSSIAYGASKAALMYMTRALAVALAPRVRVNAVAPAFTDTPWMSRHFGAEYEAAIAHSSQNFPLGRIATAQDVANAIRGLIVASSFVTGQTLVVDGGLSLG